MKTKHADEQKRSRLCAHFVRVVQITYKMELNELQHFHTLDMYR